MSSKRLGKGINAIINPTSKKSKKTISAPGVSKIQLKDIKPNPDQPRRDFNEKSLEELCSSIKEKGIITPITVREHAGAYEIIAGERRWRAAKKAKLRSVPAYVINIKNASEMMEVALIENIQRENLNPIEEAKAYETLNFKFKMSHSKIAISVGKSRVYVTNMIRLLKLPDKILQSLIKNEITSGHAKAILQLKMPNLMLRLWKKVLADSLSVRASETLVKEFVFETSIIKPKMLISSEGIVSLFLSESS